MNNTKKIKKRGGGPVKKGSNPNSGSAAPRKSHGPQQHKIIMTPNGNILTPAQMKQYDELCTLELNRASNSGNSGNESTYEEYRATEIRCAEMRERQKEITEAREAKETEARRLEPTTTLERQRAAVATPARLNNCPKGPGMCGLSGGKKPRSTRRRKRR